jgi:hypothetical protein
VALCLRESSIRRSRGRCTITRLLVGLSALLYAAVPAAGLELSAYPDGVWFFNPFAWQFLFVIGAACGWRAGVLGTPVRIPRAAFVLSAAFLALVVPMRVWISAGYFFDGVPPAFAEIAYLFADKTQLGPLRLLSFLALAVVTIRVVPAGAAWLEKPAARAVALCGQNSLPIFCGGIFLSVTAHSLLLEFGYALDRQAAVTFGGCLLLLGGARVLSWAKVRKKSPSGDGE